MNVKICGLRNAKNSAKHLTSKHGNIAPNFLRRFVKLLNISDYLGLHLFYYSSGITYEWFCFAFLLSFSCCCCCFSAAWRILSCFLLVLSFFLQFQLFFSMFFLVGYGWQPSLVIKCAPSARDRVCCELGVACYDSSSATFCTCAYL